eukprot:5494091-Prymnesium_polylepis.1
MIPHHSSTTQGSAHLPEAASTCASGAATTLAPPSRRQRRKMWSPSRPVLRSRALSGLGWTR